MEKNRWSAAASFNIRVLPFPRACIRIFNMADDLLGGDDAAFAGEGDPAAEFLARERDELGELGEEFGGESGGGVVG